MTKARIKNPHFICIGYKKTGTTWLHHALSKVPDVQLPPVKECRFYWGAGDPQKAYNDVSPGPIMGRLGEMSLHWRREYLRRSWRERNSYTPLSFRRLTWDIKYCFFPQSVAWYLSLFPKDKISGDIDPHYLYYSDETIKKIKHHLPDVKILLLLRDPIEMYWSEFRMWAIRIHNMDLHQMNTDDLVRRFRRMVLASPRFSETISRWRQHFDTQQLFIGYYDDLKTDPHSYFKRIADFIDVDISSLSSDQLEQVVHKGAPFAIPSEAERAVHEMLIPDLEKLITQVDSPHPTKWLQTMRTRHQQLVSAQPDSEV